MSSHRDLDDTDLTILALLAADARRSFRDIASEVDLSPPAVSDRVDRLREQGIIRRFTVDIDRSLVQSQTPVLIELTVLPGRADDIDSVLEDLERVEHVFRTVDDRFVVHASAPDAAIGDWLGPIRDHEGVRDIDLRLLESSAWHPELETAAFSLECVVCGNPVTAGGVTDKFDGEVKAFCCPSCHARYEDRYETHRSQAD